MNSLSPFLLIIFLWLFLKYIGKTINKIKKRRELLWPNYECQMAMSECCLHDTMNKIKDLELKPFVSRDEWLELLEFCEYADEWYKQTHPHARTYHLVDLLKAKSGMAW